ncbi:fumarylacetoacetate hydrolase family protein [Streptomyces sp. NPDC090499]|uniref:fumarylacetoacetate hydrolase family protein n=1 Tax=Streptomyces sp. NPDC090499 TaxID=3365965 RepID=UPI00382F5502
MKLASVRIDGVVRLGVIRDDTTVALPEVADTVDDVVRGGPQALDAVRAHLATAAIRPLAEVELDRPLRRFNRDILCTGWNYWEHFEESRGQRAGQDPIERPRHPTFFTKGPSTVIGPFDVIAYDAGLSLQWDYEAELALVIGKDGRDLAEKEALEHVFGYCVANDVSLRDVQRAHGGQWLKGKSIDGTMPLGPWITTADEVGDPALLRVQCEVNGRLLQDAPTELMAFSIPRLLSELSRGMTLHAGDVVLTGTPAGIGSARSPQLFLRPGDLVTTRVSRVGELRNRVAPG